jgi:hypothetical protein
MVLGVEEKPRLATRGVVNVHLAVALPGIVAHTGLDSSASQIQPLTALYR